ncbi:MAG: cofactor-independent phosphoglycerate mutase [Oscillospiraceae bacterium]|jgi:2,3-bisphosphoglycerate-independent phosphoglycerate mutase|nr:cofactor-independent phosphoglycerate mutase [Oscillospiraceae bacterium]
MKHLILLYDGMADMPCPALGGKTPMQCARKPLFDAMGRDAEVGLVQTVAKGLKPGSDVANLSVLGYDPAQYYTGRSPLEAVSMGVPLGEDDLTLRCNLVTLSAEEPYAAKTMLDYSGGDISTAEATALLAAVQAELGTAEFQFYPGVAYRHCLLWKGGRAQIKALGALTPPHDITDQPVAGRLPQTAAAAPLLRMMEKSFSILQDYTAGHTRRASANSIWLWGEGTRPALPAFAAAFGKTGSIISAVDLLKGIGILAGMRTPEVPGATGYIDTNYEGKAQCAVAEFRDGQDFVYLHIEATDECGHRGEAENKVRAIELIDERVLPIVLAYLETCGEPFSLLILPDHPTPLVTRTHTSAPVPYMLYRSAEKGSGKGVATVTEETAAATGNFVAEGPQIIRKFFGE